MQQKTLKKIAQLTQNNDHGAAYLVAAKALCAVTLAATFERINKRHEELGSLPDALYQERYTAYSSMLDVAKKALAPAVYAQLYQSF